MNRYSGHGRRRGVVWVYTALALSLFMGCAALVVDLGYRYFRKAEAQKAADAAALAGVVRLPSLTAADENAKYYAAQNGYDDARAGTDVVTTSSPGGNANRYQVMVRKVEPAFFTPFFRSGKPIIGATAIAEYYAKAPLDIAGDGKYGTNDGSINLSCFGPNAYYNNGDPYDPKFLPGSGNNPDPNKPNPLNIGWDGWDYGFSIPSNYVSTFGKTCTVEVFDPDCYNKGSTASPDGTNTYDEIRSPNGTSSYNTSYFTPIQIRLYWDNKTPSNLSDDILIGTQNPAANSSTNDMKWWTAFSWDTTLYSGGSYRVNVKPTSGSSENGYNLRAGPPHSATMSDATWSSTYGSKAANPVMSATGNIEINFNTSGTVKIALGQVPTEAAGGKLFINKFDTDVGAKSIVYTCSSLPGQTFSGKLSSDGTWQLDTLSIPANYTTGTWYATYAAGVQDTSVWTMSFSNYVPGIPGRLRLVE